MKICFPLSAAMFFSVTVISLSQTYFDFLVPKPRQAYVREEYSSVFSLQNKKIYINEDKKFINEAKFLNSELRRIGADTLEIVTWNVSDTLTPGIFLGVCDPFLNQLIDNSPDQKISVDQNYPGSEGYMLDIFSFRALINASDPEGLFLGIRTLISVFENGLLKYSSFVCRIVDAPEMPLRWFYYPTNVLVGENTNKAKELWEGASKYKLNGVNLTDYKFSFLSDMPQRYFDSLKALDEFARQNHLKIIPGVMPFGYSNGLLYHNPNLASAMLVYNQKFYIEADTGRLVPHKDVILQNPGFENSTDNKFPGFNWIDRPGEKSFSDTETKHSGKASIRFDNFEKFYPQESNARINISRAVLPNSYYHVSAWVRTENLSADDTPKILVLDKTGKALCYETPNIPWNSQKWQKIDICFNSLKSDTVLIYWGVWGARSGRIWWDDLLVEEVPFINMVRRPGTPISVNHIVKDLFYREGIDYDSLIDPKTGRMYSYAGDYDTYHQPPAFRIKKGGSIVNGDTLLISYFHTVTIYDGQAMITMSDPEVYDIVEREFRILDSILKPQYYFMNHDEIRIMNWDHGDLSRIMTPAEILADNVSKCNDIIHKYNPDADTWVWTDMFDEYHNAIASNYYLVNGDLTGSADIIPKDIGMVNWNSGKNSLKSLGFFEQKGFRQIASPFYDTDESHIRLWKERMRGFDSTLGMMYTTWQGNYSYLRHFAEYAWNHAPYINHQPLYGIEPKNNLSINYYLQGDLWDKDWSLQSVRLFYRTNPIVPFDSLDMPLDVESKVTYTLNLPADNKWLQYYIAAADNKGWITKVPLGIDKYFELGTVPTSVSDNENLSVSLRIFPNPLINNDLLTLEIKSAKDKDYELMIYNLQGELIQKKNINVFSFSVRKLLIDVSDFNSGMYIILLRDSEKTIFNRFIKF